MSKSIVLVCYLALMGATASANAADADADASANTDAQTFGVRSVLDDAKAYVTGPLRWDATDWLWFGGTLAAVGIAHEFDGKVRDHFAHGSVTVLDGKDPHSVRDAIPAALVVAGTFAYATFSHSDDGRTETYTMLEAAAFSSIATEALKFAAGRERPDETTRVDTWRSGGSSFPSLHASAAFAIGTVLAESGSDQYRWIRRLLGYGMAGATVYARLHDHQHWLSDTVAGSAIGVSTANFTMDRRDRREQRDAAGEWSVTPLEHGGAMLSYTVPLR